MGKLVLRILVELERIRDNEAAQETVEYALIVALMGFAAVAGMQSLASGVTVAFNGVSATLATSL
jgi:pilus assembly protein Flp/PilA